MKRMILAMSKSRSDLADYIEDHTFQVVVALAQLYLFPQGNRVHWRKEVWEKFSIMYTLKISKKLPSSQFILNHSWDYIRPRIGRAYRYAIDKEDQYEVREGANLTEFYIIVEDYLNWMSNEFSQFETLELSEVKAELDRLGLDEVMNL